jgi:phosphoribosyl-AMP cyclohydrolase
VIDYKSLEKARRGDSFALGEAVAALKFNAEGLIPVIAQQFDSGEVLMMAWMNREALDETLETGRVCYFSRSRQKLWRKGESSGQVQLLKEMRVDCDGDAVLLKVDQTGPACHSGRRSCFYNLIKDEQLTIDTDPMISPEELYGKS